MLQPCHLHNGSRPETIDVVPVPALWSSGSRRTHLLKIIFAVAPAVRVVRPKQEQAVKLLPLASRRNRRNRRARVTPNLVATVLNPVRGRRNLRLLLAATIP